VEVPASLAEHTILENRKLALSITPDGHIESALTGITTYDSQTPQVAEPIDTVIARTLATGNLRFEEATNTELRSLLQRLQRSADLVKQAIEKLQQGILVANPLHPPEAHHAIRSAAPRQPGSKAET
jgi:hypothetical protein